MNHIPDLYAVRRNKKHLYVIQIHSKAPTYHGREKKEETWRDSTQWISYATPTSDGEAHEIHKFYRNQYVIYHHSIPSFMYLKQIEISDQEIMNELNEYEANAYSNAYAYGQAKVMKHKSISL